MNADDLNELARRIPWVGETPIERLGLSARALGILKRAGLHTLADVRARPDYRLRAIPRLGPESAQEFHDALAHAVWLEQPPMDGPELEPFRGAGERPVSSEEAQVEWAIEMLERYAQSLAEEHLERMAAILKQREYTPRSAA